MKAFFMKQFIIALFLVTINAGIIQSDNSPPPTAPVRTPAEFEPVSTVVIRWRWGAAYEPTFKEIVQWVREADATVLICVQTEAEKTAVKNFLLDTTNVAFLVCGNSFSEWARDWGGQTIYYGAQKQPALVDWKYHSHEGDDNTPSLIAQNYLGWNWFQNNSLEEDGGNFTCDGFGHVLSDNSVYEYNQGGEDSVKQRMWNYHGISGQNYYALSTTYCNPPHIDMYLKFIDEETILYSLPLIEEGSIWENIQKTKRDIIINNINHLRTALRTAYGRPFRFVQTISICRGFFYGFTNGLIVNNYYLTPTYSGLGEDIFEELNNASLEIIRSNMPGYNVKPIESRLVLEAGDGAIHCLTHEINKNEVVRIAHPRFMSPRKLGEQITFKAEIWSKTIPSGAIVHLKKPGEQNFSPYAMEIDGDPIHFKRNITADVFGQYQYYIEAVANGVHGYKPNNGFQGGYYTLSISNDFLQLSRLSEKKAVWAQDTNTYFPFSEIEKGIPISMLSGLKIKKQDSPLGCCWKNDGTFAISGSNTDEWERDRLANDPTFAQGGLMFKRNGVPVFFVSQNGDLAFGERMYTGIDL